MKRYTVQFGTCESSDGTVEKLYVTQPDLYLDEFNKQKASFKNPDVTDESIRKIAEKVVDSRVACKLGEYEDIDTDPKQLAKIKRALDIIKKKNVFVWGFIHRKDEKKDFEWTYEYYKTHYGYFHSGYKFELLTEEEFDLLKEVLL